MLPQSFPPAVAPVVDDARSARSLLETMITAGRADEALRALQVASIPDGWWIYVTGERLQARAFGPYLDGEQADHAFRHALLIDDACTEDCTEAWRSEEKPHPAVYDVTIVDLSDFDHTADRRCQKCLGHPGWAHDDESRRREHRDICKHCLGSGTDPKAQDSGRGLP